MSTEAREGIVAVGEPVGPSVPTGSLTLDRVTVPNGPWVWTMRIVSEGGEHVASINLTTGDLVSLRDIVSRAIVIDQGAR
jgi:hypothetical protein